MSRGDYGMCRGVRPARRAGDRVSAIFPKTITFDGVAGARAYARRGRVDYNGGRPVSELINNSEKRVEILAEIINGLHSGEDRNAVRQKLAALVRHTSSEEIVAMEQKLMSQGMTVNQIKGMCDLHSQVLGDLIQEDLHARTAPGHPVHTLHLENEAILETTRAMRDAVRSLASEPLDATLARCRELGERILEVDKHYAKKENVLFPHLELHGITGPSQVMWAKDDDIRVLMKSLRLALLNSGASLDDWRVVVEQIALPMLDQIDEMVKKEEKILFPMALKTLSPEEWGEVYRDASRFGSCLVEAGTGYEPPSASARSEDSTSYAPIRAGVGSLTPAQLNALIEVLPVDLTFVDADDRVAFFSEGKHRIFSRSPSIIGRKVQNCHPPQSVGVVEKILADFRSGKENVAEFWINFKGRFVHIRYFAVRSESGEYLGTLEVTQDLSHPRSLAGERRLLEYEGAA